MAREMRNVTFSVSWTRYNAGERASFPKDRAKWLVEEAQCAYYTPKHILEGTPAPVPEKAEAEAPARRRLLVKDEEQEPEQEDESEDAPEEDPEEDPEEEDEAPKEVDPDEETIPGPGNALLPLHKGGGYYNLVDEDSGEVVRGPFKKGVLEALGYFK